MVYQYEYAATRYAVPAQQAGEYMEMIRRQRGQLTPAILLEESRSEDALLHNCFEWNDTEAAEKYRLNQSRLFIANIKVTVLDDGGTKKAECVRAFVNVSDQSHRESGVFVPIMEAISNRDSRDAVLQNAIRELEQFKNKYSSLYELSKVFDAIDTVKVESDSAIEIKETA